MWCDKCDEHCQTIEQLKGNVKFLNEQLAHKTEHVTHLQGLVQSGKLEVTNMHAAGAYLESVKPLPTTSSEKATAHMLGTIKEQKTHIEYLKKMVDGEQIKALHERCTALENKPKAT